MKEKYVIKNTLENYIFSSISEECYGVWKESGFSTIYEWHCYVGSQYFKKEDSKLAKLYEFADLFEELDTLYGLPYRDSYEYLVIYFRTGIWEDFREIGRLRYNFFKQKVK